MPNPKTNNLGLDLIDRTAPGTTYLNLQTNVDDNWEKIDAKFGPGGITDTNIGNRTVDDTATPNTGPSTITNLFSFIGKMIRLITGEASWITAPAMTLKAIYDRFLRTPTQSTQDMTYFVDPAGSDTNDGLSAGAVGAFKTIAKMKSMIPSVLDHVYTINVAPGTYAEDMVIKGPTGKGNLTINGAAALADTHVVQSIFLYNCAVPVTVNGLEASTTSTHAMIVESCSKVILTNCKADAATASFSGVMVIAASIMASGCLLANKSTGIFAHYGSKIFSDANTGTGNQTGLVAGYGGLIAKRGTQPAGTTAEFENDGGQILP